MTGAIPPSLPPSWTGLPTFGQELTRFVEDILKFRDDMKELENAIKHYDPSSQKSVDKLQRLAKTLSEDIGNLKNAEGVLNQIKGGSQYIGDINNAMSQCEDYLKNLSSTTWNPKDKQSLDQAKKEIDSVIHHLDIKHSG